MRMTREQRKISIIVPAYNEEKRIRETLEHLRNLKFKEYPDLEIIVSVNGCIDKTIPLAQPLADKIVILKEKGLSRARNSGAESATGEILVFMDADVRISEGTLTKINEIVEKEIIGAATAYPNIDSWKAHFVVGLKNFLRWSGIIKGISQLIFCHSDLVKKKNIFFDPGTNVGEIYDFFIRARRYGGARYKYIRYSKAWSFSLDRYEKNGYVNTFLFWVKWWYLNRILKRDCEQLEKKYWSSK